jgi:mutator protein MutT
LSSVDHSSAVVHVVAGVLRDAAGRVLIAERPAGKHLSGSWEFPGGKRNVGEARLAALERELHEELGVRVEAAHPFMRVRHSYEDRRVLLDVWIVERHRGDARGLDGQRLRWCDREELERAPLLPADRPIQDALALPVRLTAIATPDYHIVDSLAEACPPCSQGPPSGAKLRGVLCGGLQEAQSAAAQGARFLVLREPLSPSDLAAACEAVDVPVYARGLSLETAWRLGAAGINEI